MAIQGFGNAGSWAAKLLVELGFRVVGISDVHGAFVNEAGIDIDSAFRYNAERRGLAGVESVVKVTKLPDPMKLLEMDPAFLDRSLNEGFSGGEKKRNEILQMALLRPELSIMDETDSGLDIDALKVVSEGVNKLKAERPESSYLLITHYQRILNYIKPDAVHVMVSGRIVESGGPELAEQLEVHGYEEWGERAVERFGGNVDHRHGHAVAEEVTETPQRIPDPNPSPATKISGIEISPDRRRSSKASEGGNLTFSAPNARSKSLVLRFSRDTRQFLAHSCLRYQRVPCISTRDSS